jgi:beta-mannan synthase
VVAAGILDLKQAQEWVVTTKLGSSDKRPGTQAPRPRDTCRFYMGEMLMSTFVLTAAFYGIFSVTKWHFSVFLTLQGIWTLVLLLGAETQTCLVIGSMTGIERHIRKMT